ncbi:hypothetical protein [Pectobacterium polaris]|uniref:hypothetical protein n=1 Tax=Pectobacterium polaris TaxID=2042057 RepID=UPI00202DB649|nr:hypothetical protein [Pectobacterium polaris]MCL6327806.1 hypothetical protein [Pectobacterium polaris]
MDSVDNYLSLSEVVNEYNIHIKEIIQKWIDGDITLFVHFESHPCRIRQFSSSMYTHEGGVTTFHDNPFHDYKKIKKSVFIQEHNFFERLVVVEKNIYSNFDFGKFSPKGKLYEFVFFGTAFGFWVAKPTYIASLSKKYSLTDLDTFKQKRNIPGAVLVYRFHGEKIYSSIDCDHLIFDEPVNIERNELFARENDIELLFPNLKKVILTELMNKNHFNETDSSNSDNDEGEFDSVKYYPALKHRVALYIIIREWWGDREANDETIAYKAAEHLKRYYNGRTKGKTIEGWIKKPEKIEHQPRIYTVQIETLSIFINEVCKEKCIRKSVSAVAKMLTALAQQEKYKLDFSFSKEEVKNWL